MRNGGTAPTAQQNCLTSISFMGRRQYEYNSARLFHTQSPVIRSLGGCRGGLYSSLTIGSLHRPDTSHASTCAYALSTAYASIQPRNQHACEQLLPDFTKRLPDDPDTNLVCMLCHLTPKPVTVIAALYANMAGVERPPILDKWLAFPEVFKSYKKDSILGLLDTTEQATNY